MKKVLFIGPKFYNFEIHIIKAIEKLNFEVDFYNEKPEVNMKFRIIQKMPKLFLDKYLDVYYKKIISTTKQYDFVFIIRAEMIKEKYFRILKKNQKNAKFIMYQWDFYDNLPNIKNQLQYFDKVYTFDANDAKNHNLILKPLFFTLDHKYKAKNSVKYIYKLSFIGSHHSDRFEFIKKFIKINNFSKKDFFYHLYRPKLSYIYNKYIARNDIGDITYKEIQSKVINDKETLEILNSSEMILDIHHVKQAGLTIRSLEALGLKKKLITTNPFIVDYDFYNENNICLIDRENPKIPEYFYKTAYEDVPDSIYNSYCVDEWVKDFFKDENQ